MSSEMNKSPERKLVTIASGKGGVGKTWFSVTLAHTLAHAGRKVLLFDGDLGLANIDIQLGLLPDRDVGDVISGAMEIGDVVQNYPDPAIKEGRMDIVVGKSGSGALGNLSRETLSNLRKGLIKQANEYDYVLLDMAAGIDASVTTLSNHDGVIFVVLTADPTSLTDAYAFIKVMSMRHAGADFRIVVNNVASLSEGKKAYEAIKRACEGFLKISPPLAGIIRNDKRVVDAIRSQKPLLARHPQSDAAKDVSEIVRQLSSGDI
ncbi:MAG: MinD/ParA family protein [Sphingomonadales bacterium]|nr:MinD/ParA family protein [Sphingomonadales bacterium]